MTHVGSVREDGRVVRPMFLMEVKRPAEVKEAYDTSRVVAEIPARDAIRPLPDDECPLVVR